jgi:hypothetical protein
MKLSDIKTHKDFYEFADIWYQRTKRLAVIMMDESIDKEKRFKALKLWRIMFLRVQPFIQKAIEISKPKIKSGFKFKGGIIQESGDEHDLSPKLKHIDLKIEFERNFNNIWDRKIKVTLKK